MQHEFKVRPVGRFLVTHWQKDDDDGTGSSRAIGEFPNLELAREVADALGGLADRKAQIATDRLSHPGSLDMEFVVVSQDFDVHAMAFYAYTQEDAQQRKAECERQYGGRFSIFCKQRDEARKARIAEPDKFANGVWWAPGAVIRVLEKCGLGYYVDVTTNIAVCEHHLQPTDGQFFTFNLPPVGCILVEYVPSTGVIR